MGWGKSTIAARAYRAALVSGAPAGIALFAIISTVPPALAEQRASRSAIVAQATAKQSETKQFDIPAQPLSQAVTAFGEQSGLQVTVDTAILANLRSSPISGSLTPDAALTQMLSGTDIGWRYSADSTVVLVKSAAGSEGGPVHLAPMTVTANREGRTLDAISRNVTVIDHQALEQQSKIKPQMSEILEQLVPGMAPSSQTFTNSSQTLRGRKVLVLIDGVPQNTNRNVSRDLFNIDPSAVDKVEVVHGGSAVYGGGASGGTIHISTLNPSDKPFEAVSAAGLNLGLSNIQKDSLGGWLQQNATGTVGKFDYVFSGKFDVTQAFFDSDGDRIPPEPSQGGLSDTTSFNLLGKGGVNFGRQRVQVAVNYRKADQDSDYASDPSTAAQPAGSVKAKAIEGLQLDEQTSVENLMVNLDYINKAVFGGDLLAQAYYRDYKTRFHPFDGRPFSTWNAIAQSHLDSQVAGGRFTLDTPFSVIDDKDTRVLSGFDYKHEVTEMPVTTYDGTAYDSSGGLVFMDTGDRVFMPETTYDSIGLYGQLEYTLLEKLLLRGGVRHEWVFVSFDDYTTLGQGNQIPGGTIDYSETVFNAGAVYSPIDSLDFFANYAQSFELPDIGLQLRYAPAGFNVDNSNLQPIITDNYEIGTRLYLGPFNASVAGFYSKSDLGRVIIQDFALSQARTPERIYGVEASADYRVTPGVKLGGTFTWQEGEVYNEGRDEYIALNGHRIPPIKVTGFVDYEIAPWWRGRLQVLYSGSRDRAFEDNVGFGSRKVDPYTTVDLYNAFDVGPGTLTVAVENLLNNRYQTVYGQLLRSGSNTSNLYARGATLRVSYGVTW